MGEENGVHVWLPQLLKAKNDKIGYKWVFWLCYYLMGLACYEQKAEYGMSSWDMWLNKNIDEKVLCL